MTFINNPAINKLKSALAKGIKMSKAELDFSCFKCSFNFTPGITNDMFGYCSRAHPCTDCHYFPYLNGTFVGCMCGVDPCAACNGTTKIVNDYGFEVYCGECVYVKT